MVLHLLSHCGDGDPGPKQLGDLEAKGHPFPFSPSFSQVLIGGVCRQGSGALGTRDRFQMWPQPHGLWVHWAGDRSRCRQIIREHSCPLSFASKAVGDGYSTSAPSSTSYRDCEYKFDSKSVCVPLPLPVPSLVLLAVTLRLPGAWCGGHRCVPQGGRGKHWAAEAS